MLEWINKKRNKKGFTLVELVVVIAILGILSAIAVPKLGKSRLTSQVAAHNANVRVLKSTVAMYIADNPTIGDKNLSAETTYLAYLDSDKLPVRSVKVGTEIETTDGKLPDFKVGIKDGNAVVEPDEAKISTDGKTVELVTTPVTP